MKVRELTRMGANNDHLKLKISKNGGASLGAVGWGMGALEEEMAPQGLLDLAVQLEVNTWQDKSSIQLLIVDLKPSDTLS
jgi:single-stranded-DNA-specific exonuclease